MAWKHTPKHRHPLPRCAIALRRRQGVTMLGCMFSSHSKASLANCWLGKCDSFPYDHVDIVFVHGASLRFYETLPAKDHDSLEGLLHYRYLYQSVVCRPVCQTESSVSSNVCTGHSTHFAFCYLLAERLFLYVVSLLCLTQWNALMIHPITPATDC